MSEVVVLQNGDGLETGAEVALARALLATDPDAAQTHLYTLLQTTRGAEDHHHASVIASYLVPRVVE